jgi:sulfur carrier protein ThiS
MIFNSCFFKYRIVLAAFFAFYISALNISAQEGSIHKPSLTLGFTTLKFNGDVGKQTDVSPLRDARFGYYFAVEQRFGKVLGVSLGGMMGKMAGNDNSESSKRNFESKVLQGELLITANFDKVFKEEPNVSPFLNAGIGFMTFDPYGDLKNGSTPYYYWKDGSIRDKPELPIYKYNSKLIKRDYTYETQLKDSTINYARNALILPFGAGFNFHFGERWVASIGANYVMCLSDYIDNYKDGSNDNYFHVNVGLQFEFKKKTKSKSDEVNFDQLDHEDSDKDGVEDSKDMCMDTPKGVKIDENGCPIDTDNDGVADYLDKEKNSKPDAVVDVNGVTIKEGSWTTNRVGDSVQVKKVKTVIVESSGSTNELAKISKSTESTTKNNTDIYNNTTTKNSSTVLPTQFKEADYNNNGVISADEITRAIDDFFDGKNDFTAEKINQLVDYFFEQ